MKYNFICVFEAEENVTTDEKSSSCMFQYPTSKMSRWPFQETVSKGLGTGDTMLSLVNLRVKEEGQATRFKSSKNDKK